jgi:hypothetical protein
VAHERGVGARAQREAKGVDQEALARAGLPGQDVEPPGELQAEPVDEREVGDRELEQAPDPRAAARPEGGG